MTNLSVCVITKNEEKNLGECLKSVKQVANEIILVDTGSEDRTKKIARYNGAKVFHSAWKNDFSLARNFALDKATGEWILQLDADERLHREDVRVLQDLIEHPDVDGYVCQIINIMRPHTLTASIVHEYMRLFRKQVFRYEGIVHEQLIPFSAKPTRVERSNIRIFHDGYLNSKTATQKANRNVKLLEKALKNTPDNAFLHFTLGQAYGVLQKPDRAYAAYEKAEAAADSLDIGFLSVVVKNKCSCLKQSSRLNEAVKEVESACQTFPDYPDVHFLAGQIFFEKDEWEKAIIYFDKCMHMPRASSRYGLAMLGLDRLALDGIEKCKQRIAQTEP